MPMKKTFEKLSALQEMDTDSMTAEDAMDTLGGLCAEILSHNMTGEQVTTKEITDDYDRGNGSADRRLHGVRGRRKE